MTTPPFDNHSHKVTAAEAAEHTRRHRATLHPNAADRRPGDHAGAFRKEEVLELLGQKDCWGLRIYHGRHPGGERSLVLVGTDANGRDLAGGSILERCFPCPPYCDPTSPLAK